MGMKINPSQIDKLYNALAAESASTAPKEAEKQQAAIGSTDSLSLSEAAKNRSEIDSAVNLVVTETTKSASAERLLRFKNEIQNGTYRVPSDAIAEAMLGNIARGD
jgi:anti-sigma28 factor (negative regulator of flagellin synthesis)